MAMTCVLGDRECTGCMEYREEKEPEAVFECCICGAEIFEGDMYYNICGEPYCEDCVYYEEAEKN